MLVYTKNDAFTKLLYSILFTYSEYALMIGKIMNSLFLKLLWSTNFSVKVRGAKISHGRVWIFLTCSDNIWKQLKYIQIYIQENLRKNVIYVQKKTSQMFRDANLSTLLPNLYISGRSPDSPARTGVCIIIECEPLQLTNISPKLPMQLICIICWMFVRYTDHFRSLVHP